MQYQKCPNDAGGDRQTDHQCRTAAAEEHQEYNDSQDPANQNVLVDQANCGIDVLSLVVDLCQHEVVVFQN